MRQFVQAVSIAILLVPNSLLAQSRSESPAPAAELSLILEPGAVSDGVPQTFTFHLINISAGAIRLPQPNIDCANPTHEGNLWLSESWQPSSGMGLGKGSGSCGTEGSALHWRSPSMLELAKKGKLLQPGESIYITATNNALHYESTRPGTYTFSAEYLPPSLSDSELQTLRDADIVVPQTKVVSRSLQYRK